MQNLRQVFLGIIIAIVSIGLLLGAILLSQAEGNSVATFTPTPTPTLTSTPSPTRQPFTPPASSIPSVVSPTPLPSVTPTLTLTPPVPPANCPPPSGWLVYFVQPGETLDDIAASYQISSAALQQANCLVTPELLPGAIIYVPALPTQTPVPCGPPASWITYFVQPGDTLYHLSQIDGVTVTELQRANCLGASTILHTGQILHVPPWAPFPTSPIPPIWIFPPHRPIYPPRHRLPSDFLAEPYIIPTTDILTATTIPTDLPIELPSDTPIPVTT